MNGQFSLEDLQDIMRATIGVDDGVEFGADADIPFADHGYDSLAMLELASQLERQVGMTISDDVALEQLTSPRRTVEFVNSRLAGRS